MTAKNRAGLITKLQSSLKKHYKPAPAAPGRPLLEHILYAALLEDAPAELADEGFAMCEQEFFDWNEVRVTSVTELAEVLSRFPSPATTAARLKRCLQNVFEGFYNFDLDHLKKENLSKAVAKFETMNDLSPFVLAYLTQHGLGGHAIPVSAAAMQIMLKAGIVSEAEAATGKVPGLERAIPKSKAIEFSSMLHQAAVALQADRRDPTVWEVITAVNQDAQVTPEGKPSKPKATKRAAAAAPAAEAPAEAKLSDKPAAKTKSKAVKAADKATDTVPAAAPEPAAAAPSSAAAKPAGAKSTPAKSTKSAAAKPQAEPPATPAAEPPAKKSGTKATKKSGTGKAATSKSAAIKGTAPPTEPSAGEPAAADASPSSETAAPQSDPAASGTGSQKLSKQKPR